MLYALRNKCTVASGPKETKMKKKYLKRIKISLFVYKLLLLSFIAIFVSIIAFSFIL